MYDNIIYVNNNYLEQHCTLHIEMICDILKI